MGNFIVSCDKSKFQIEKIHSFLTNSYWAKGINIETVKISIENSLCFGVFDESENQVGFARLVTDYATFAYLADVYILEEYRGLGLSKRLMTAIAGHEIFPKLRRLMLATRDAHGLYKSFGFEEITNPEIFMQIARPDIYFNKE